MTEPEREGAAGNGLQVLGVLVGVAGVGMAAAGYVDLDASKSVEIQYLLATALPALVGGGLLYGVGCILSELRNRL